MNDSTNQDTQRLKQMLEDATTAETWLAGSATAEGHDAETASLREAWLAFEQLIRAADAVLPALPNIAASMPANKPHRRQWLGLMAAAAAALLVAVALGWWIHGNGKQGNNAPSLAESTAPLPTKSQSPTKHTTPPVVVKQDLPKTAVAQVENNKQPKAGATKTSATQTSPWDDPLETQIASVSQQISNVAQNWQHRVDEVDLVQYRIDEVTDSLQNDKL